MLRCHNQHDNLVFLDASETECNGKAKMKGVGVGLHLCGRRLKISSLLIFRALPYVNHQPLER